jgi:hypothetical protein
MKRLNIAIVLLILSGCGQEAGLDQIGDIPVTGSVTMPQIANTLTGQLVTIDGIQYQITGVEPDYGPTNVPGAPIGVRLRVR